jgi:hypothetical protein
MYLKYKDGDCEDAVVFLINELGHKDGADRFIYGVMEGLGLSGRNLVHYVHLFNKFHHHDDYSYANLLRTRKHFKNLAFTYLDDGDYKTFNSWIKHWSNLLIICRHSYPERWKIKNNFEDIR